jgi:nucleoside-diphosphate-sugar epimerase
MNVLVTGGAGYVGSVLVPLLLRSGYSVRVLDNLMYGGQGLLPHFANPNFEFVRGDVRHNLTVLKAARGCQAVVHLAAIVGFPACRKNPDLAQDVNWLATTYIAEAAKQFDQFLVFSSTGSNYGAIEGICTEDSPLNPLSVYGRTKSDAESYVMELCDDQAVALRFATGFGVSPRMRLDLLVNDFVHQAVTEGYLVVYEPYFRRSFIHVRDMARAIVFALQNAPEMGGQVYNVGSESMNYSKAELCEIVKDETGCYVHFADVGTDADKRDYEVSYEKISRLGYETKVTLRDGIDELIRAMQAIDVRSPYSNV